jgi:hypothetical protein
MDIEKPERSERLLQTMHHAAQNWLGDHFRSRLAADSEQRAGRLQSIHGFGSMKIRFTLD